MPVDCRGDMLQFVVGGEDRRRGVSRGAGPQVHGLAPRPVKPLSGPNAVALRHPDTHTTTPVRRA